MAAGQTLRADLEAPVQPIAMEEIPVVDTGRCLPLAEGRRDAFLLWEEARKALVDTVIAERTAGYRFDLVLFERRLEPQRLRPE